MTKHTLAKDQHAHEMTLIVYLLPENKFQADGRVTLIAINKCPSMPYTCITSQSLIRGTWLYAFSTSTKHAKTPPLHTPRIS